MKVWFSLGERRLILSLLTFLFLAVSCKKGDHISPKPPRTVVPVDFSIQNPTAWYNQTAIVTYEIKNATSVTIDGLAAASSGTRTFPNLKDTTYLTIEATDSNGVKTSKKVMVPVYSERVTNFAFIPNGKNGIWAPSGDMRILVEGQWITFPPPCEYSKFYASTGLVTNYGSKCNAILPDSPNNPWKVSKDSVWYYGNGYKIITLTENTFVRQQTNSLGQIVEQTFTKN